MRHGPVRRVASWRGSRRQRCPVATSQSADGRVAPPGLHPAAHGQGPAVTGEGHASCRESDPVGGSSTCNVSDRCEDRSQRWIRPFTSSRAASVAAVGREERAAEIDRESVRIPAPARGPSTASQRITLRSGRLPRRASGRPPRTSARVRPRFRTSPRELNTPVAPVVDRRCRSRSPFLA